MTTRLAWPALLALAVSIALGSGVAEAQKKKKPKPKPKPAPAEPAPATQPAPEPQPEIQPEPAPTIVPTEDEGPIPEPKVPADPMALVPPERGPREPAVRYTKRNYPTEIVLRPLTLAASQAEINLEVPFATNDGDPWLTQVLRAAFGVTVDLQLGLTYAVGLERLDAPEGEDSFEVGKAFSIDAAYTIIPAYLAAELRLAFLADPDLFGMGIILGLPFKITLAGRWKIYGGADLVRIRIKELAVDPANPAANLAVINRAVGSDSPVGGASLVLGLAYQARPDTALYGTFGVEWPDFDTDDQPFSLWLGATYTPARAVDVGARVGFYRLDDGFDAFGATIYAALRL